MTYSLRPILTLALGCGLASAGAQLAQTTPSTPGSAPKFSTSSSAEANAAWQEVLRLDAGPASSGAAGVQAEVYRSHLEAQEKALQRFLQLGEGTELLFEAGFRLARVLALRAEVESSPALQEKSEALLDELEKKATPAQGAHIAFARIAQWMRRNRIPTREQKADLLAAAREFRDRFPSDLRAARLLVEVATQFDHDPEKKRTILAEAAKLNPGAELRRRIGDELRKLGLLGKPLALNFTDTSGRPFKLEQLRGRITVLLYFSESSPPSINAWRNVNETLKAFPQVARVGISLDESRPALERVRQIHGDGWIIACDGMGWNSPMARRWGINSLPTAWVIDPKGRLVSLQALEDLPGQITALGK